MSDPIGGCEASDVFSIYKASTKVVTLPTNTNLRKRSFTTDQSETNLPTLALPAGKPCNGEQSSYLSGVTCEFVIKWLLSPS